MKNIRRILAWTAIILLASMYILSLIFALIKSDLAASLFRASLGCTIIVPVFLYLFLLTAKAVRPNKSAVIDCLIFDLGNVLLSFPWKEYAEEIDVPGECRRILLEKIVLSPLWVEFDLNNRPAEEIIRDFMDVSPEYGEEIRRYILSLNDRIEPFWYTSDLVKNLKRKGYRVYFLSNWSEYGQKYVAKKGVMDFLKDMDGGVWSFEEHLAKPDVRIFRRLRDRFHLTPERCVFIDDVEENVRSARSEGFAAIRFTGYNDLIEKLAAVGVRM